MKKTIMILGAGYGQLPAIEKAKKKGYRVITASIYPNDVGMSLADVPLNINTIDIDGILEAARHYEIDGIMTMATDVAIPSVGKVVDELGLAGSSFNTALLCTDKLMMKNRMLESSIPTANAVVVRDLIEAKNAICDLGLPAILKPTDSSGSRGITKLEDISQLEHAFAYAETVSRSHVFLIEEFIDGFEFGAQGLVRNGKMMFLYPHNDTVTPPPYSTPIGHSYPMALTKEMEQAIFDLAVKCTKAFELENSMLNFDFIMTDSGPKIIEIGARMGATCLPELTTIYSGTDIVDVAIEMAFGNKIDLSTKENKQPCAALLIRSTKSGMLQIADAPQDLKQDPRLVAIRWDKNRGDMISEFKTGPDRIGEIVVVSDNRQEAEQLCLDIERRLVIEVDENC